VVYPYSDTTLNVKHLKQTVESVIPGAYIHDHKSGMNHLTTLVFTVGVGAFFAAFLSVIAVCLAIVFVIHAAVMANKNTLEVLCFVGAHDDFIAREFQSRFLMVGLKGAALGVLCAMSVLFVFHRVLKTVEARHEDFSFFVGQISPNGYSYLTLVGIGLLVSGVTTLIARMMVYHQLEK
jgi:cell division transport system permease protein